MSSAVVRVVHMKSDDHVRTDAEKIRQLGVLEAEAETIRERDKVLVRGLFRNFYGKQLKVGIGFTRAWGAILSGDYFDLIHLPDGNYLFVFADISGHGLPAYTNLVRLRSAITIATKRAGVIYNETGGIDFDYLVRDIVAMFTDVMEEAESHDFACVIFTFIYNEGDKFHLKFYNRSMLFPVVIRKFMGKVLDVYNLNCEDKGWFPNKANFLSCDVRAMLGDQYYVTPSCTFTIYEGDTILYFSDGIIESCHSQRPNEEFGEERLIQKLLENINYDPQAVIYDIFNAVYEFIGRKENQKDDMTAVLIDFPSVRT